jgi:hypothetical protein
MSIGPDATEARSIDNYSLADALISFAALLRLNPEIPDLYSVQVTPTSFVDGAWEFSVHPRAHAEEQSIDAVRTFAALLDPGAALHLSEPHTRTRGGTYRQLKATGERNGARYEVWTFIAETPADAAA